MLCAVLWVYAKETFFLNHNTLVEELISDFVRTAVLLQDIS